MEVSEEQCMKFPAVLREKLRKKEIIFPDSVQFHYDKIKVYRAVTRGKNDFKEISRNDFRSYYELGKKARGVKDPEKDPHYYGVSFFLDRKCVEQQLHFPRPNKKLSCGYVNEEGGPQETNMQTQHVCWWLFEDADVSGFSILED